jgi:hypothetical protein
LASPIQGRLTRAPRFGAEIVHSLVSALETADFEACVSKDRQHQAGSRH